MTPGWSSLPNNFRVEDKTGQASTGGCWKVIGRLEEKKQNTFGICLRRTEEEEEENTIKRRTK